MKRILPLIFFFALYPVYAQQDTSGVANSILNSDSTSSADTTAGKYAVDTTIYATSTDSLIYYISDRKMDLYGNGELKYKDTDLKSANIHVDFETSNIEAIGTKSDTARKGYIGSPQLDDKGEKYEGIRMKYNFKTRRGYISSAGTQQEGSTYTGLKIKKVDSETYFIQDGIYTTCPLDTPHYFFYANEMKVIHKEQVVSKWIWLNFGGVPFPIPIPFAVFPIESGRRSGILAPAFGDDPNRGRYFSRFGYFWAISDYMDINFTADYYTRGSYNLASTFRYAKRYDFSGNLNAGYFYEKSNELTDPDYGISKSWRLRLTHNQTIDPTTRLDANLEFMSGTNYLTRNTINLSELLRTQIVSSASLNKSWEQSGNSMSLGYNRTQDIQSGNISEILPTLTFNMSQKYPFRKSTGSQQEWYETFGYRYQGQLQNTRNKQEGNLKIRGGILHSVNLNFSPKIGFFNFTPFFNYEERWYNKKIDRFVADTTIGGGDSIVTNDVKQINMVRSFRTGISASTRFFGMFQPGILGISALRHTVQPSISYNYTPDFSNPSWGYYGSYINGKGEEVKYSRFEREVFRGPSAGEQQNISFSLDNIFEIKTTADPTDTTSKEEKIQLLNLSADLNYNFAADSLKFSPLSISARTQIGQWLNFQGGSTFSFYKKNDLGSEINRFNWEDGGGLLRLTNFNFSVSTSLSGEKLRSTKEKSDTTAPEGEMQTSENRIYKGIYDEKEADFTIPWDVSLTYRYNYSKYNIVQKSSNISGGLNFNLTPSWKFSFSGSYDIERKEIAAPSVRISKDLHCWIMNFTWYPIGRYRGYQFEIRVKAPQLQDLKITKRDSFFSGK